MLRLNFWRNPENLEQKKAHLKFVPSDRPVFLNAIFAG